MRKIRLIRIVLAIILLMWSLIFNNTNAIAAKTLKIGGTMPLNIGMGVEAKRCWELYVDYINKSGGLDIKGEKYNLELILYDDKYTAEGGKAGVERLLYQYKCRHIIGMIPSASTYAGVVLTEQEKVLMMSGCATDKVLDPQFKYFIRMGNLPSVTVARWDYVTRKYPNAKTYALIAPDDETGHSSANAFKESLTKHARICKDEAYYPRATTDFSAIGTRIKTSNPDFVIFPADGGETDFALKLKALYQAGYRGIRVAEFFHPDVIKKIATNEQIEGVVAPVVQSDMSPGKRNKESILIEKLYREKYGNFITTGITWMKPLYAFLAAIKKANSLEVDNIMAAFAGLEFMHGEGMGLLVRRPDFKVNRYVDTVVSYDFGIVRNGKVVFDESMTTQEVLKACENVFGGGWK
jgi:ABC-type branched-subunit amino acid transport system substrate-binding protein